MIRSLTATMMLLAASGMTGHAQTPQATEKDTRTLNLSAYAELLRADVRLQKVAIITEVMGFTEAEDKAFWPIYREYDAEMAKLGDERVALVAEYANNYAALTDQVAEQLAAKAIDLSRRRDAALAKCYERVKAASSAKTALRFLQVENQLLLLIDLQIAAALPIAK